jgi:septal ring factor EnvC (AmiA/AmiB activator)
MQRGTLWLAVALGMATDAIAGGAIERGRKIYHLPEKVEVLDNKMREQLDRLRVQRVELERQITSLDHASRRTKAGLEARDAQRQLELNQHIGALNAQRAEIAQSTKTLTRQIVQMENRLAATVNTIEAQRRTAVGQLERWLWISALVAVAAIVRRPLGRVMALLAIRRLAPKPRRVIPLNAA